MSSTPPLLGSLLNDGSFAVRVPVRIYTVTSEKDGGRYTRTFTDAKSAAEFATVQRSYGCTVTVRS